MNMQEFSKEFLEEVRVEAISNVTNENQEFLKKYTEYLIESEEISDFRECYFEATGKKRQPILIEGYNYDDADGSYSFFISDLEVEDTVTTITKTEIVKLKTKVLNFIENAINGYIIENFEESSEGYNLARDIKKKIKSISKIKIYVISNKKLSERIKSLDIEEIEDIKVETKVWDINRLFNIITSSSMKESIEIEFKDLGIDGLPTIMAVKSDEKEYTSFLTAINGKVLADLYIEYGARLLEGNVRSFLSTRGKVNKDIKKTILQEPEMFFAYNNGIAATATNIKCMDTDNGMIITSIEGLQIINGGQTTASIANVVLQDKEDVSKVIVPMKLSVVTLEKAEDMIPVISRCANSQNKVSEADFFSNHPYHIKLEELSRKIYAPAKEGNQYETLWFYERARGQHAQEQMKLSKAQRDKYLLQKPKNQLIKKVELAKYINSYNEFPHIVSRGAQANMRYFAEHLEEEWKGSEEKFNKEYYKKIITLAIIFKETERLVSDQKWYKEIQSYRANIVTYAIAVIFYNVKKQKKFYEVDFNKIWLKQTMYDELRKQLVITTREVFDFITSDDRTTLNVTEWCKKETCWKKAQQIKFTILDEFLETLVRNDEACELEQKRVEGKEEPKVYKNQIEVFEKGIHFWKRILEISNKYKIGNDLEVGVLTTVISYFEINKKPSYKQAKIVLKLLKRMENDGFVQ